MTNSCSAIILMDLQVDFLDAQTGRMPVMPSAAGRIIEVANWIFSDQAQIQALEASKVLKMPVIVANEFPRTDRIANFFRRHAALAGSPGARLDPRIQAPTDVRFFSKSRPSAFTNPEFESCLRVHSVTDLTIMGVFAEGCVRATALDAVRKGFKVTVPEDGIGTNAPWKKTFALWSMRRNGVAVVPSLIPSLLPG